jgi:hypothetical protein
MRILALLLFLLWQSGPANAPSVSALEGAWLQTDAKWTNAPQGIARSEQYAQTAVLYFGKEHKFALIYCSVIRGPKQYMAISNGDRRGVYRGQWRLHENTISVTYQLVEQTIPLKNQEFPGPMQNAIVKIFSGPTLNFDGKRFRRAVALDDSASH